MIRYMLDVKGTFGHDAEQFFPILLGLNNKGGMDVVEFFEYLKKLIMKLYPDAAPMKGRWVVIKSDSSPGRLNSTLLTYLRYHSFILYPGVPNTTAVTQETDQSYGPFQTAIRTNLQLLIIECIATDKPRTLLPNIVRLVVFGGEDPETGLIVGSAFQKGFSHAQNICAWEKSERCRSARAAYRAQKSSAQLAMIMTINRHWSMRSSSKMSLRAMPYCWWVTTAT